MAEAPLSLLLGRGAPRLVAEDRHLLPGVRLRRLRLRPTFAGSPSDLIRGGPGRVGRLLERLVTVERCEIELREEAIAKQITQGLCGLSISGMQISSVDLREISGETMDVEIHLRLVGIHGKRSEWGARIAIIANKTNISLKPRTLWSLGGVDPILMWAALRVRALGRGVVAENGALHVDPLQLWIDRWLVLDGHRPLRTAADAELRIRRIGHGCIELLLCECTSAHSSIAEAVQSASSTVMTDAPARIKEALRAGQGLAVYDELAIAGGRHLPESVVLALAEVGKIGEIGEISEACAALELALARGSRQAGARLAILRGRAGDRGGLLAMLAQGFRVSSHPVHRARFRIAWALCTGNCADGVREARQELEALVAEIGDGGWPSSIVGEAWAALARLRGADPEVSAELVFAAAIEASHHMGNDRGGETLLWAAVDLHDRGVATDELIARRARIAGFALTEEPDPEILDRLRCWRL